MKVAEGKHVMLLERDGWEYVERKKATEAVAVIAETPDGELVFTEQFRNPVNARVIDWPAGLVGDEADNDDPAETAKKELEEETGYSCAAVELLTKGPTSPGITSEQVALYRALDVWKKGEGGGVGGEDITVHLVPKDDVAAWLRRKVADGVLVDLKVWAGLYFS